MAEQKVIIKSPNAGFQERFTRSNCDVAFGGGVLGPQPLTSRVLTPTGYRSIADLKVGDEVCGIGTPVQTITHNTPEGLRECIRVVLDDGTSAESALSHKWHILRNGEEMTAVAFELLESFQICQEKGERYEICLFRMIDGIPRPVRISLVEEIGEVEVTCIGVSNEDELYITDNEIITKNCGKTYAAVMTVAEPTLDPNFRAVYTRRNLGNLKSAGGIVDEFKSVYGDYVDVKISDNPRITFPSGAVVDCMHIADEARAKLTERLKGMQYDFAYMDELTSYAWTTFSILGTRIRGVGQWTGHVFGTTNPKRSHWVRKMLDWYIGVDGFIRPDRDGVVRYYYAKGDTVDDLIWGSSKKEVYMLCKPDIDKQMQKAGVANATYENFIRSFVFYLGRMGENKQMLESNPNYLASVAAVGGRQAQQFVEGNWNVDEEEEEDVPISGTDAQNVFTNDECINGDNWITADLADTGTDNLIALHWNGLHVDDILILMKSTPRLNYEKLKLFAQKHNTPESHIIYDGTHGTYMADYMPDAIPFLSSAKSQGLYALEAERLKDACYIRLINVIRNGRMSISEKVAQTKYTHQGIKEEYTCQTEFLQECAVVRIEDLPSGRKKLMNKKKMNALLGKNRSMDLLDPCAMRMYPLLQYQYGDELEKTASKYTEEEDDEGINIYDESFWA